MAEEFFILRQAGTMHWAAFGNTLILTWDPRFSYLGSLFAEDIPYFT